MKPGNGGKTRTGDFVQKLPMGIEAQATGKFMPADAPPRPGKTKIGGGIWGEDL